MVYTIVIKVQYRDILRRFNAKVDENYKLDIDMDGLRAKISRLFGFSPYANLTLTYIDEDGDEVTLVDNDELRDVINQELDFLMIHVVLNGEKWDKFPNSSSERRPPLRYPRRPPTLPGLSSGSAAAIAEVLKSLPEPFLEELSKLALDSVTKAACSSPLRMVIRDIGSRYRGQNSGASAGSKDERSPQEELLKDATSTTTNASENGNKQEVVPNSATKPPVVSIFDAPQYLKSSPATFPGFGQLQPPRASLFKNSTREEPAQIHNIKPAIPSSTADFSTSYVPAFRGPSLPSTSNLFQPSSSFGGFGGESAYDERRYSSCGKRDF